MKLFVTILEETQDAALEAMRRLLLDHDGVEIRAERFSSFDPSLFRRATAKPIIITFREKRASPEVLDRMTDAGIDYVDIEYEPDVVVGNPLRTVLSFHDFEGMPDISTLVPRMCALRCAHTKIAATPRTFEENQSLLRALAPGVSVIGMGERGLYSRILAPFLGSELSFVAPSVEATAAPGQLTLHRALEIYGQERDHIRAKHTFAVLGDPAGHSLSPSIHNRLFREKGVGAAYTVASFDKAEPLFRALFDTEELRGLSITAPFKEQAFEFARRRGAQIGQNAREAGAINTMVRLNGKVIADNTDVDAFNLVLAQLCGRDRKSVALIGAGGTARAALIAIQRAGMHVTVFNRTHERAAKLTDHVAPLADLDSFDGEIVINTTTMPTPSFPARSGMTYVASSYSDPKAAHFQDILRQAGVQVFDGLDLLQWQAERQHELFMQVFNES